MSRPTQEDLRVTRTGNAIKDALHDSVLETDPDKLTVKTNAKSGSLLDTIETVCTGILADECRNSPTDGHNKEMQNELRHEICSIDESV